MCFLASGSSDCLLPISCFSYGHVRSSLVSRADFDLPPSWSLYKTVLVMLKSENFRGRPLKKKPLRYSVDVEVTVPSKYQPDIDMMRNNTFDTLTNKSDKKQRKIH